MEKEHRSYQIGAGLALFLSLVVLMGCASLASLNENLAEKRAIVAAKLGLAINCPCDVANRHCHKYNTCNYCPPGYTVHRH